MNSKPIPVNTQKATNQWNRVYLDWAKKTGEEKSLETLDVIQLNQVLQKFIREVKNKKGKSYSQSSLNAGVAALMRFWNNERNENVDFYKDKNLKESKRCLNEILSKMQKEGIGNKVQVDYLTKEQEVIFFWNCSLLNEKKHQMDSSI